MNWYTTHQAAERLGLRATSITRMASQRIFPNAQKADDRWLIPHDDIEHYRAHRLGRRGGWKRRGVRHSVVRRVVQLRMERTGRVVAKELALDMECTPQLVRHYLREMGARHARGVWTR